jgi:predicted MPP superfamily phosphohydrolase
MSSLTDEIESAPAAPAAPPLASPDNAATRAPAPQHANRVSRRRFLRRALALAAVPMTMGAYATKVEPFWLDAHEFPIVIAGLPRALDGYRIAHLTDLHAGVTDGARMDYLTRVVRHIDTIKPDCVAVTGDLVNHTAATIEPVAELLSTIPVPVLVSFGNHDYAPHTARPKAWTFLADPLQAALEARGCAVLRNRAVYLTKDKARLWFVGLEDLYTTRFSPQIAYRGVNLRETIVALSHNPDSANWLQNWGTKLILSGHTHGGQIRIPGLGAPILPLLNRRFEQGLFQLRNQCQMYVSRGVGYLYQARLFCRPELPLIVLRSA